MQTDGTFKQRYWRVLIKRIIYKGVVTVKETQQDLENHLRASNREAEVAIGGSGYQKPEKT